MTNREILSDVIEDMSSDGEISQEQYNTLLLTSIANSLAIIADVLTDRKGNSNEKEDYQNSCDEREE